MKSGADLFFAVYPDRPAHHLGEVFADGKAEPGAAVFTRRRGIDLAKRLKQPVHPIRRNADAGIAHGKA